MLILISDAFDPLLPGKLKKFGEVTEDKNRLTEADVVLVRSKTQCDKKYIDSAPKLKLIIRGGVGIDNIDKEYAGEKAIQVNNTPRASAIAVSELTFALMLAVPNLLIEGHNSMMQGKWIKKELKRTELYGKNLGLVGAGNIAIEVARRAAAFGMKVFTCRKSMQKSEYAELKPNIFELAAVADYMSLHVPLTDNTRGMINSAVIDKMKEGAVLINTGRGGCIDAEDVTAALNSGKLRAYATDVWPTDPPSDDYPILKAPNVIMTPHIGASSRENLLRIGEEVETIIEEFVKGGKA